MVSFSSTHSVVQTHHVHFLQILSQGEALYSSFWFFYFWVQGTRIGKFDQTQDHPKPYLNVWIKNFAHFMIAKETKTR